MKYTSFSSAEELCDYLKQGTKAMLELNPPEDIIRTLTRRENISVSRSWVLQRASYIDGEGPWPTLQKAFALAKLIDDYYDIRTDLGHPSGEFGEDVSDYIHLPPPDGDPTENIKQRIEELHRDPRVTEPKQKRGKRVKKGLEPIRVLKNQSRLTALGPGGRGPEL